MIDDNKEKPASRYSNLIALLRTEYLRPAFLICVVLLGVSGLALSATIRVLGIYLRKEPLLLKTPLTALDAGDLGSYRVVRKDIIDNEDVIETLGTEDYIQWQLEDTSVPDNSPVRFCALFITYYALPDIVPHVPDECYTGGGFQKISSDDIALKIAGETAGRTIPAKYVVFATTQSNLLTAGAEFSVFYTFSVNGDYASGRQSVRMILNRNIFRKYSYFSKVEWKFYNQKFGQITFPDREEAIRASQRLLEVILPVLESRHWPAGQPAQVQAAPVERPA